MEQTQTNLSEDAHQLLAEQTETFINAIEVIGYHDKESALQFAIDYLQTHLEQF